jgi:hypothetical protein
MHSCSGIVPEGPAKDGSTVIVMDLSFIYLGAPRGEILVVRVPDGGQKIGVPGCHLSGRDKLEFDLSL